MNDPRRDHRAVVYLDRDGTINDDPGYLRDPAGLVLLEGAAGAIARLNRLGVTVVLVTNQSGIGRGLIRPRELEAVHEELARQLGMAGAHIDAIEFCPHRPVGADEPEQACDCRKPEPGLVEQAREDLRIASDVPEAVIGDRRADVALARRVGARAILVLTGRGEATRDEMRASGELEEGVDAVCENLAAGVQWLVDELGLAPLESR